MQAKYRSFDDEPKKSIYMHQTRIYDVFKRIACLNQQIAKVTNDTSINKKRLPRITTKNKGKTFIGQTDNIKVQAAN